MNADRLKKRDGGLNETVAYKLFRQYISTQIVGILKYALICWCEHFNLKSKSRQVMNCVSNIQTFWDMEDILRYLTPILLNQSVQSVFVEVY